ncbi:MAG TPA: C45 family peptidase [Actinomycetes bacterium]|nr:C45 family peptidase [Actinomycetes bacterium]
MELLVVQGQGSPQDIGRAHGEQARALIHQSRAAWREAMAGAGHEPDALVDTLSRKAGFRTAVHEHLPDLLSEISGIAEGSGLSDDEIFAMNCLDEAWWWKVPPSGCSTVAIGATETRPAVCGQNMDLDDWMNGTQVVLRQSPTDGNSHVMLSRAGMIGLCGVNEAGVAVMVNTLPQLPVATDGVPVAFVLRAALAARTVNEAAKTLQRLPHASGQAYTLTSSSGVIGLECGAGVVVEYINDPELPEARWHTNHPLTAASDDAPEPDSQQRMDALDESAPEIKVIDGVKQLLADGNSGICMYADRWPGPWMTFGSVAVELTHPPVAHVAPGPPDRTPWSTFSFAAE